MNPDQNDIEKIAAYLAGELSVAEQQQLETWRRESSENEKLFQESIKIWASSGKKLMLAEDETDTQWQILKEKLDDNTGGKIVSLFRHNRIVQIAASVLLLIGVSYFFFKQSKQSHDNIALFSGNEVATLYLRDSSRVWLNTNSKLSYSNDFGERQRAVKLEGEAYFEVKRDEKTTFLVETGNTLVKVTGTAFNVKEGPDVVTLTVAEGSVEISNADAKDGDKVTVKAREKAVAGKGRIEKTKNDNSGFASWRKRNNPVFENEAKNAKDFLRITFNWKKNKINQSVIEGVISNKASLAAYKNIVLQVTYAKPNGKSETVRVTLSDIVMAGETVPYKKRLLDIFTDTRSMQVVVESAEVVEKPD